MKKLLQAMKLFSALVLVKIRVKVFLTESAAGGDVRIRT